MNIDFLFSLISVHKIIYWKVYLIPTIYISLAEVVFVNISGDPSTLFVKDYFWVGVMDRTSIVFTVKLEKHAIVLVSELAFQGKEYAYEFEIQVGQLQILGGGGGIQVVFQV